MCLWGKLFSGARAWLLTLCALTVSATCVWSQTATTGAILGDVTDSSGAMVVNATVTLTDVSTNTSRTATTNEAGQYTFVSVLPGSYRLVVQMKGFRTHQIQDLKVDVAKSYQVTAKLEVGGVAETVEVVAAAGAELQTLDSTVGSVLKGEALLRLTTPNRSAAALLQMQPMVVPSRGVGVTQGGQVAGARSDQNQFNLDGADATDLTSGTAGYFNSAIDSAGPTPSVPVPIESIEEFRVSTTNPNATFGRSAGGQVSFITKRGSNQVHGSAYWYHQNDNMNANTWTSNRLGIKRPELKDNRFGLSLGGPVFKDKTFLFGHYEGRRLPRSVLATRQVPSSQLKQGILRFVDASGGTVSYDVKRLDPRGVGLSPVIRSLWNLLPEGNDPTGGDGLNTLNYTGLTDATQRMDFGVVRLDHHFSPNWRLNTTYRYSTQSVADTTQVDLTGLTGGKQGQFKTPAQIPVEPKFWSLQLSGNLRPTMINELSLGYTRNYWAYRRIRAFPQVSGTTAGILAGFNTPGGLFSGIDIDTQSGRSRVWRDQTYQLGDNFTWLRGKHTLQFGGSIRRMPVFHERDDKVIGSLTSLIYEVQAVNIATITSAARPPTCGAAITANCIRSGDLTRYNALFGTALGMVDKAGVVVVRDPNLNPLPVGTPMRINATFSAYEMYAQDVWRVTPALTVTAGLTYSIQTPPVDDNKLQTLMIDANTKQNIVIDDFFQQRIVAANAGQVYNPTFAFLPIAQASQKYIYDIDWNNFGPRIAAAWNPSFDSGLLGRLFGHKKSVIRTGYGVTFDRTNGVGVVMLPVMGAGFTQTNTCNGPRINGTCAGSSDETNAFRLGVDGATVPLPVLGKPSSPVTPDRFGEALSFSIDPKMKIGKSQSVDFTLQRELPGGFLVELGYAARISNNLPQNFELNSVPYFMKDSASGQTFAQAYDAVANQLRSGVAPANVTLQPWFENQLRGFSGCNPNCTVYLANGNNARFQEGSLNPLFNAIVDIRDGLRAGSGYYNRQIQNLHVRGSGGESFYNAGFINLTRRFSKNLAFNVSYTLAKTLDQYGLNQESIGQVSTPYDLNADWGPAIFDRRHVFNSGWFYELPFGKGQHWSTSNPALDRIVGGWYVSGTFFASSGLPLAIGQSGQTYGGAQLYTGLAAGMHPKSPGFDYSTTVNPNTRGSSGIGTTAGGTGPGLNIFGSPEAVFNSVRNVQLSLDGRHRRDIARGLSRYNLDLSIGKKTKVNERLAVAFSAEALNLTNRVEFSDPSTSFLNASRFGVILGQFNAPRQVQLGLRIEF